MSPTGQLRTDRVRTARGLKSARAVGYPSSRTLSALKTLWSRLAQGKKPAVNLAEPARADLLDDPYPFYHQLRAAGPVRYCDRSRQWLVTGYEPTLIGLRDPRLAVGRVDRFMDQLPVAVQRETSLLRTILSRWLFVVDPPLHTKLRGLLHEAFTPATSMAMERTILRISHLLLDKIEAGSRTQTFDLAGSFANPLPTMVMADLLGFPREDWPQVQHWTDRIAAFLDSTPASAVIALDAQAAMASFAAYLSESFAAQRSHGEIVERLLAEKRCGNLEDADVVATCTVLFAAGMETTSGVIGNAVLALLRAPAARAALSLDDASMSCAVEEFIRFDSPVQITARVAREDIELGGQRICAGATVALYLGAANRDPGRFADPDRLDLQRRDNRHLGFSQGAHYCLGAALARIEVRIALQALLSRFPDLELSDQPAERRANLTFRGLKTLPVRFRKWPAIEVPSA